MRTILLCLLLSWQGMVLAQYKKSATNSHITFGSGINCEVSAEICSLTTGQKAVANVQTAYDNKTGMLRWTFRAKILDPDNLQKLLAYPKSKDVYTYPFTHDYFLPANFLNSLGLKGKYYIPKGNYKVTRKDSLLILYVPLKK